MAVAADLMAKIRNEEVVIVLSKILSDLVVGEFQQLQNKSDTSERFELYLAKTFNKTASLIAYRYNRKSIIDNLSLITITTIFFLVVKQMVFWHHHT